MIYTLKHYDTPLIRFSAETGAEPNVAILWVNEADKRFLPLDMEELSAKAIESWVRNRSIPKNRAYVNMILSSMGLSINRPFDILRVSKGLSLNDCYWVTEDGFEGSFAKYNLYDNRFSRMLGQIAFSGYGSGSPRVSSSPELTTNGMLPKCWRREQGVISLYKGGTDGASNTGFEPYSEFYAAQIAEALGVNAIKYGLSKWKGTLCSTCELFTTKELSYVPVGRIVRRGGMKAVREYYEKLGDEFVKALNDMLIFDAVILNTDRHFGNFGFLVNNETNRIVAPAPLFDHGNSLLNFISKDAIKDKKAAMQYVESLQPCVYNDFIKDAKPLLTHESRGHLRKLLDFQLKKHSRYNLPPERLKLIEFAVQEQVKKLLED